MVSTDSKRAARIMRALDALRHADKRRAYWRSVRYVATARRNAKVRKLAMRREAAYRQARVRIALALDAL